MAGWVAEAKPKLPWWTTDSIPQPATPENGGLGSKCTTQATKMGRSHVMDPYTQGAYGWIQQFLYSQNLVLGSVTNNGFGLPGMQTAFNQLTRSPDIKHNVFWSSITWNQPTKPSCAWKMNLNSRQQPRDIQSDCHWPHIAWIKGYMDNQTNDYVPCQL
ncbi:hypothetical protein VP01_296g2 [Puccinia sorghi]|uniref:Uncharacterized protein n=1 Tax=Puccinia sorghi TaxID=27349 RepID=A0A0L6V0Q4_9BASI|nr:hypothetical protein VP01_296g2 [Puccinia sorghi]